MVVIMMVISVDDHRLVRNRIRYGCIIMELQYSLVELQYSLVEQQYSLIDKMVDSMILRSTYRVFLNLMILFLGVCCVISICHPTSLIHLLSSFHPSVIPSHFLLVTSTSFVTIPSFFLSMTDLATLAYPRPGYTYPVSYRIHIYARGGFFGPFF